MSDQQTTPTAREQWLRVALAVARDGMPHPRELEVRESGTVPSRVELTFDLFEPAAEWAERLGLATAQREMVSNDGKRAISTWTGRRDDGWRWTVCAYVPLDAPVPVAVPLAAQVTAAIEASSGPTQYGELWACPVPYCGFHITGGPTPDGQDTLNGLITEHVTSHSWPDCKTLLTPPAETKIWTCPHNCGYHIADGPVAPGESPTFELITEHFDMEHDGEREPATGVGATRRRPVHGCTYMLPGTLHRMRCGVVAVLDTDRCTQHARAAVKLGNGNEADGR